mgnify:CR=1 FL=1
MSSTKEILHFKRDSIIFKEGDKADCMYKVKYGFVEIYLNYKEKNQKLLTRIGHDEFFGEMALLDDTVRSATAVSADSTTQLIAYSKEDLLKGSDESTSVRSDLLRQMSDHLVRLTDTYMDVCKTIAYYKASEEVGKSIDIDLQKAIDMYSAMFITY